MTLFVASDHVSFFLSTSVKLPPYDTFGATVCKNVTLFLRKLSLYGVKYWYDVAKRS